MIRQLFHKAKNHIVHLLKWVWSECKDWHTIILLLIVMLIVYSPVIVCFTLFLIFDWAWAFWLATTMAAFWLGPFSPFLALCIAITLGIKRLFDKKDKFSNIRLQSQHKGDYSMFEILSKEVLNPTVIRMDVYAPAVAKKAEPGQFIILRTDSEGERIPLTVADYDRVKGSVTIIFQIVGATTEKLGRMEQGDCLCDFVGPLGRATETEGVRKVAIVGGGVGCAIAYPVAKKFHEMGVCVHSVVGFRNRDLVILENDFRAVSDEFRLVTDDGSTGEKGLVTDALRALIESGEQYDRVITIGPLIMMKFVCALTKEYNIPTVASMNPIMIDGTGMCGGCRLTVGGETKFACVDGPEFDGHLIDFDEAMARGGMYRDFERHAHEQTCNLFRKEEE